MPPSKPLLSLDLTALWAREPPRPDCVLPGLLAGTVGNVVAAGGTGKSFFMLATALGIAIGRDVGRLWGSDQRVGRAVFLSLEDPEPVLHSRLHAFLPELTAEDRALAARNLQILSYAGKDLSLATLNGGGPRLTEWYGALEEHVTTGPTPRLLVIDTLNRALGGLSENDAAVMGWLIAKIESLALRAKCAIVLCHHVSKQAISVAGTNEAQAARGSSVIVDNARWQCNLWIPGNKDDGFRGLPDIERHAFVRLAVVKSNYGPPIAARLLHRGEAGALRFHAECPVPKRGVAKSRKRGSGTPSDTDGGEVATSPARAGDKGRTGDLKIIRADGARAFNKKSPRRAPDHFAGFKSA